MKTSRCNGGNNSNDDVVGLQQHPNRPRQTVVLPQRHHLLPLLLLSVLLIWVQQSSLPSSSSCCYCWAWSSSSRPLPLRSTTAATTTTTTRRTYLQLEMKKGTGGGGGSRRKKSSRSAGKGFVTPSSSSSSTSSKKTGAAATAKAKTAAASASPEGPSPQIFRPRRSFPYTGPIRPFETSPQKVVRDKEIIKPDYHRTGTPGAKRPMLPWMIEVKNSKSIQRMRESGRLAREILDMAGRMVKPGVTTDEIDTAVHEAILERGAYPSPLNYQGFPKSCCTSVNEVICHGIPDSRPLAVGDLINVDITVYLNGYHGDCSEMFVALPDGVSTADPNCVDAKTAELLQTTYDSWILACQFVKSGVHYKDIGAVIEDYVAERGFTTVKHFCGHGVGQVFHTNPSILHYRNNEPNGVAAPGHTFTIEPMICEGSAKPVVWPDNWTATTADGKRSAQFEHTLLVAEDGGLEALTGKTSDSPLHFWELQSAVHKGAWLGTSKAATEAQDRLNEIKLAEYASAGAAKA